MSNEQQSDFYAKLGEAIRHKRIDVGMTQLELSNIIGMARTSIVNIEQGKQGISAYQFWMISDALGGLCF